MVDRNQLFTGLIAGVVVGAVTSLLLAPKTGKEIRHIVVTRAADVRGKAGQYATSVREKLGGVQSGGESAE